MRRNKGIRVQSFPLPAAPMMLHQKGMSCIQLWRWDLRANRSINILYPSGKPLGHCESSQTHNTIFDNVCQGEERGREHWNGGIGSYTNHCCWIQPKLWREGEVIGAGRQWIWLQYHTLDPIPSFNHLPCPVHLF